MGISEQSGASACSLLMLFAGTLAAGAQTYSHHFVVAGVGEAFRPPRFAGRGPS